MLFDHPRSPLWNAECQPIVEAVEGLEVTLASASIRHTLRRRVEWRWSPVSRGRSSDLLLGSGARVGIVAVSVAGKIVRIRTEFILTHGAPDEAVPDEQHQWPDAREKNQQVESASLIAVVQSLDRARDPCPEKSNTRGENEQHNQDEPDDRHGGEIRCVVRHRVGA